MLRTPGGRPASSASSPILSAVMGDCSAGFSTTELPMARAGAIFHIAISSGKFHGTMAPMTPSGSCSTKEKRSGVGGRDLAVDLVERFGVVAQRADRAGHVALERVRDRLAHVEALEHGEDFGVALHQIGEREQDPLLVAIVQLAPAAVLERLAGGGDREIDIGCSARPRPGSARGRRAARRCRTSRRSRRPGSCRR